MSRIDDLKKQNPELNVTLFDILQAADPSKTYKYMPFLIKMFKKKQPNSIELNRFILDLIFGPASLNLINKFEDHSIANRIKNSDITSYKSFEEIGTAVEAAEEILKLKKLEKQVTKLKETDEWIVMIPLTYEAAKNYGSNTKWCITQQKYWDKYRPNYRLIFVLNKVKNLKFAISKNFNDNNEIDAWDAEDKKISPLMLPLPTEIMAKVVKEVRKPKNTVEIPILGDHSIFIENGDVVPINEATVKQLEWFIKNFSVDVSKKLIGVVEKRIREIEFVPPKSKKVSEDSLKIDLEEYRKYMKDANLEGSEFNRLTRTILGQFMK